MKLLPLLLLTGVLPGCATPGEGTPRGVGVAAGHAGAPCILDRQAKRPAAVAPAPGLLHAAKDGSDVACTRRDGRGVTVALAPKPAGTSSGYAGEVGPVVVGAGAGEATSRPPSRVRGVVAPAITPVADFAPASVSHDDPPFITTVPNPFRAGTVTPEPVRGAPRPSVRTAL